jgi:hypothetical protein
MALRHGDGVIEVACIITDYHTAPTTMVEAMVQQLAAQHGVRCGEAYRIGLSPQDLVSAAISALPDIQGT